MCTSYKKFHYPEIIDAPKKYINSAGQICARVFLVLRTNSHSWESNNSLNSCSNHFPGMLTADIRVTPGKVQTNVSETLFTIRPCKYKLTLD